VGVRYAGKCRAAIFARRTKMTTDVQHGSPQFPTTANDATATTTTAIDSAIQDLQQHKDEWARLSIDGRVALLDALSRDFATVAPRFVEAGLKAKGRDNDANNAGEEWLSAAWPVARNLRLLRQSLLDIKSTGHPRIPGPVQTLPNGQVVAQVFPQSTYDRIFFGGVSAEIWMQPGVQAETLAQTQAVAYQQAQETREGKVALVLGAGNVASIGPMDILYKMFVENMVVVYKSNPVNAYLTPLLVEIFGSLVAGGFLRFISGGASEGAYLCNHAGVDEVHITGSDKTFDAIVFGSGQEGAERKRQKSPVLHKRITGELGNVSPLIIVPGPWSEADLAYQAEHIVSSLVNNAGFNCNATRLLVQSTSWERRPRLLQLIQNVLRQVPERVAYYPGAQQRQQAFVQAHPDAEQFGQGIEGKLPWTFIPNIDASQADDIALTTEAFCGLFAETTLDADSTVEFMRRAIEFCNERVWGTLVATILIHPQSLKEPAVVQELEDMIARLRYGTIGVNYWGGTGYTLGVTTWGAFPGHSIEDIQSGTGVVHNTLMFDRAEKSVVRGPFRSTPKPPWFALQGKTATRLGPKLTDFETSPAPLKVPAIVLAAIRQ
jgi:acyl-CoA reductase-like NAD-dependent aldehyde dehydrogenase